METGRILWEGISQKIPTILQARRDFTEGLSRAHSIGNEAHFQHFPHPAGLCNKKYEHKYSPSWNRGEEVSVVTAKSLWTLMTILGATTEVQGLWSLSGHSQRHPALPGSKHRSPSDALQPAVNGVGNVQKRTAQPTLTSHCHAQRGSGTHASPRDGSVQEASRVCFPHKLLLSFVYICII